MTTAMTLSKLYLKWKYGLKHIINHSGENRSSPLSAGETEAQETVSSN